MGLSNKRRAVLVKLENVYNTDAAPVAATDGVLMAELDFVPLETEAAERKFIRAFFGSFQKLVSTKYGKITLKLEVAGYGTAGPAAPIAAYDALLQACGLAGTVTASTKWDYTPISSTIKSVSIYVYVDGRLHKFTGCRGNLKMAWKANEIPYLTFEMWGNYSANTDAALVSPVLTAYQQPLTFNRDNSTLAAIMGAATGICLESFDFDLGNTVVPPTGRVNCPNEIFISDRAATGNITVEGALIATKDWWTLAIGSAVSTFDATHGTAAGNKVQFSSSRMDVDPLTLSDQDNLEIFSIPVTFPPLAGGDDFKLTIL